MLELHNPHSVLAALETRPEDVSRIVVPPGTEDDASSAWQRVVRLAQQARVDVSSVSGGAPGPARGDSRGHSRNRPPHGKRPSRGEDGGRAGVAHAMVRERDSVSAEELFSGANDRDGGRGLWLALDTLQDPHNLGAIFRAAAFFGVQGILLTEERSAPLSASAYDVSSGGIEYVPFCLQTNLQRGFEVAKDSGLWILGATEHAHDDLASIPRDRAWLLVLGNEEKGMRRLTQESCDMLCKVTPKGAVTSLNVSVAAGIFISALSRR